MKLKKEKIKVIYILIFMLLFSVAMLIIPLPKNKVHAQMNASANALEVIDARIEEHDGEWAIMFKVQIDKESYNSITNYGYDLVKFGMLIGPSKRIENITDYQSAINQEYASFLHVGTQSAVNESSTDNCTTIVKFENGATLYNYEAGIIYDSNLLSNLDLKEVANLELSVIPIYATLDQTFVVMDNAKTFTPKLELVNSYAKEKVSESTNVSNNTLQKYIGQFSYKQGEYYVCQSTNRLMGATTFGADLNPIDLSIYSNDDELFIDCQKIPTILNEEYVQALISNDNYHSFAICKGDETVDIYSVKIAKRVICRMFKEDRYLNGAQASALQDYYAFHPGDEEYVLPASCVYVGIFYNTQKIPTRTYDGLYVLANKITPTTMQKIAINNSSYYRGSRAVEGKGFIGVFDGRGNAMDFNYSEKKVYAYCGGLFNSIYGATIRNVAFVNLYQYGVQQNFISFGAHKVNFDNVYIKVDSVQHFNHTYNQGLLIQDARYCSFNNFVVECDTYNLRIENIPEVSQGHGIQNSGLLLWPYEDGEGAVGYNQATNFFAVGSNPIYLDITNPITVDSNELTDVLTNYMVNEEVEFLYNTNAENYPNGFNWQKVQMNNINCIYREIDFWDSSEDMIKEKYINPIRFAYEARWSEDELYAVSGIKGLKLRFCKKQGFRNVSNYTEMNQYLKSNSKKLSNFINQGNNCWNVNNETGQVTWKKLAN